MRMSDWSSDVCSSDLVFGHRRDGLHFGKRLGARLRLLGGARPRAVAGDIVLQLGALRILRGLCSDKLRLPFGPLALELVITAGIKRGLAVIEVKDVIDEIVQQVALMAQHHHRRPRSEEQTSELQSLMS